MAKKKVNAYILLDRSGSMSSKWTEAIGSINEYVGQLQVEGVGGKVTVACFDSGGYDILRNQSKIKSWTNLNGDEATPRSMTPLNDASMRAANELETQSGSDRRVLVVISDGLENDSREYTADQVRRKFDLLKEKNWDVIELGAEFRDIHVTAASRGIVRGKFGVMNEGMYGATMRGLASQTSNYVSSGSAAAFDTSLLEDQDAE